MRDLQELYAVANRDLLSSEWTHHCLGPATGRPCCKSQTGTAERAVVAAVNALLGSCDPIPAESGWTHLLRNMKITLLRRVLFRVGIDCFTASAPSAGAPIVVDMEEQASEAFIKAMHQSRIEKTAAYYNQEGTFHQLAVYTTLLEACDSRLLYPPTARSRSWTCCTTEMAP